MSDIQAHSSKQNWLLGSSLDRPVLVMLSLYSIAWIIKIFDTFVFRLDELIGEAILTKALGFILVAAYVWVSRRRLSDIGFHARNLGITLLIAVVGFGLIYALTFTTQLVILKASGEEADLVFSAIDPKTGLSGGLFFGLWLVFANLVNSAMEEGLFRGIMLRHFLVRFSKWGAIFLQAALFSLWHLSWPLRHLLDGQVSLGVVAFEAFGLTLSTLVSGVVYGYFYYRTNNLWGPFVAHTINNSIFNVLFIRTTAGMQSGLEFIPFALIFLTGHLLMIPIIAVVANRLNITESKPWGEFTLSGPFPTPKLSA
jgi:membrane protease YdiL (CAAX protease family)